MARPVITLTLLLCGATTISLTFGALFKARENMPMKPNRTWLSFRKYGMTTLNLPTLLENTTSPNNPDQAIGEVPKVNPILQFGYRWTPWILVAFILATYFVIKQYL